MKCAFCGGEGHSELDCVRKLLTENKRLKREVDMAEKNTLIQVGCVYELESQLKLAVVVIEAANKMRKVLNTLYKELDTVILDLDVKRITLDLETIGTIRTIQICYESALADYKKGSASVETTTAGEIPAAPSIAEAVNTHSDLMNIGEALFGNKTDKCPKCGDSDG